MNFDKLLRIIFPFVGLLFFIIHGLDGISIGFVDFRFTIDIISISLLVFASIPFLGQFLETIKAGDVEAKFRNLSFPDQVLTFLYALAAKRQLTFYKPRKDKEHQLGTAGNYLIDEMFRENRRRTIREIKKWLNDEEENLKWFAAEIIGFFNIIELAKDLKPYYSRLAYDDDWADWQLNCLWAHSKLTDDYKEFNKFLIETESEANLDWALDVFIQMYEEGDSMPLPSAISNLLNKIIERKDVKGSIKEKASKILIRKEEIKGSGSMNSGDSIPI